MVEAPAKGGDPPPPLPLAPGTRRPPPAARRPLAPECHLRPHHWPLLCPTDWGTPPLPATCLRWEDREKQELNLILCTKPKFEMPKAWEKQFKKSLGGRDFCFYDLLTFSLPSYAAGDYRIHVGSKSGLMPGIVDVNSWITVTRVDATHVRQRLAGNLKFNLFIPGLKQVVERIVIASLGTAYDAIGQKVAPAYFERREENLRSRGFQGCPSAIYRLHPEVDKYRTPGLAFNVFRVAAQMRRWALRANKAGGAVEGGEGAQVLQEPPSRSLSSEGTLDSGDANAGSMSRYYSAKETADWEADFISKEVERAFAALQENDEMMSDIAIFLDRKDVATGASMRHPTTEELQESQKSVEEPPPPAATSARRSAASASASASGRSASASGRSASAAASEAPEAAQAPCWACACLG